MDTNSDIDHAAAITTDNSSNESTSNETNNSNDLITDDTKPLDDNFYQETSHTESNEDSTEPNDTNVKQLEDIVRCEIRKLSINTDNNQNTSKLQGLCDNMFTKVGTYLNGEVDSTCADYQLIIDMNRATSARYTTMFDTAKSVGDHLVAINQQLSQLHPYLDQIENIEKSVLGLEQAAYKLDLYSKQLEDRFKLACKK